MTVGQKTEDSTLEPALDEERVERLWSGVATQRRRKRIRARAAAVLTGVTGVIVIVALVGAHRRTTNASEIVAEKNVVDLRSVDGAEILRLDDGSVVRASPGARFSVKRADAANVLVSLESGSIDVTARASAYRSFSVKTSLGTIETRDARFDVELSGQRLVIDVTAGELDLHRSGVATERLRSGARWESAAPLAPSSSVVPAPAPSGAPAPIVPAPARGDAAQLLEQADTARLARDAGGAARLLDELRTRFPSDPNAGLAAFEAGRIYLRRAEPARAADAFRFAVGRADDAFREDAEAGLAQALSEAGDRSGCAGARDAYLEHYPSGAHRGRVGALCR